VFNVDADEVVTPELAEEIVALFTTSGGPELTAYGMPLHMIYPGAAKPRPYARDNWYVRLYDRRIVRFRNSRIHDAVVTDGQTVGRLNAPIHHFSMRSFEDMKRKLDGRMWLQVENQDADAVGAVNLRLLSEFPMSFLKYYLVRRHFTGGVTGLRYAAIQARYRFLRIYRIWQSDRRRSLTRHSAVLGPGSRNAGDF
jgi:hypothetical protein